MGGAEQPEKAVTNSFNGILSRTFRAFSYRDFRLLWGGAFTSATGTWMQMVAQAWVVLDLSGSAFYLGLVGFLGQLPILLFTLLGGVFADRIDRRKLLLFSQYVQLTVAVVLTILVYINWIEVWHFLVLVFISGSGQAFGGPAYQALVPNLVRKEDVANAVALNSIQFNLARVIGPVIAGAALASVGAVFCFGLNALSFFAVIVALYLIRTTFVPPKTNESVLIQIKGGFSYIWSKGDLWQLTVLGFVSTFCGVPLLTLLPVYARDIFGLEAAGYSNMMAISGMGSIVGALLFAAFSKTTHQGVLTLWVQLVFGILICMFAISRNLFLSCFLLFLTGLCLIGLFASITSLVQTTTDDEMRGRMLSIFMLAFRGGMPLGDLLAGWLASQYSPTLSLIVLGTLLGAFAIVFLVSPSGVKRL